MKIRQVSAGKPKLQPLVRPGFVSNRPASLLISTKSSSACPAASALASVWKVKSDVWSLLASAYRRFGVRPTLLERDFNFPPMTELLSETERIRSMQLAYADRARLLEQVHV